MKKFLSMLAVSAVVFSACSTSGSEKERYTEAVTEATCVIFGSSDMFDPAIEEKAKKIFEDKGFDVNNEEAMIALAEKYDTDPEVQAAIEEALQECAGDFLDAFNAVGEAMDTGQTLDEVEMDIEVEEEAEVEVSE